MLSGYDTRMREDEFQVYDDQFNEITLKPQIES